MPVLGAFFSKFRKVGAGSWFLAALAALVLAGGLQGVSRGFFDSWAGITQIKLELQLPGQDECQVFYNTGQNFSPEECITVASQAVPGFQTLQFGFPENTKPQQLRFDPGTHPGTIVLKRLEISTWFSSLKWQGPALARMLTASHDLTPGEASAAGWVLQSNGNDPYLITTSQADQSLQQLQATGQFRRHLSMAWCLIWAALIGLVWLCLPDRGARAAEPTPPQPIFKNPKTWAFVIACVVATVLCIGLSRLHTAPRLRKVMVTLKSSVEDNVQLFFDRGQDFTGQDSAWAHLPRSADYQTLTFSLPEGPINKLRLDPGSLPADIWIKSLVIDNGFEKLIFPAKELEATLEPVHDIPEIQQLNDALYVRSTGTDPNLFLTPIANLRVSRFLSAGQFFRKSVWLWTLMISLFVFLGLSSALTFRQQLHQAWSRDLGLVAGFSALILLPLVGTYIHLPGDIPTTERRNLAACPDFSAASLRTYPKDFQAYFEDHFGFRNLLTRWENACRIFIGRARFVNKIRIGENGWMDFNAEKILPYPHNALTTADLEKITYNLEQQKKWFDQHKIRFFVFIPCNKVTIYPEFLTGAYRVTPHDRRLEQALPYLKSHLSFQLIEPSRELLAAKKLFPVYYQTDSHWNFLGGFIADQVLIREMAKTFPQLRPLALEDIEYHITRQPFNNADIAALVNMNGWLNDLVVSAEIKKPARFEPADLGKVLVFHDSMIRAMAKFFPAYFKNVHFIHHQFKGVDNYYAVIEKEKPQVVIYELCARWFDTLN